MEFVEIKIKDIKRLKDIPAPGTEFFNRLRARMIWRHEKQHMPALKKKGRPSKIATIRPGEVARIDGVIYYRDIDYGLVWRVFAEQKLTRDRQVDTIYRKPFPSHRATELLMGSKAIATNLLALTPSENSTGPHLYHIVKDVLDYPPRKRDEALGFPLDSLADMAESWADEPEEDLDIWPRIKQFFRNAWEVFTTPSQEELERLDEADLERMDRTVDELLAKVKSVTDKATEVASESKNSRSNKETD